MRNLGFLKAQKAPGGSRGTPRHCGSRPRGDCVPAGHAAPCHAKPRRAFSLVELLVGVSIILVLMGLVGAALSSARTSQKRQATQALIAKLDGIIQQQFVSYATRTVPIPETLPSGMNAASYRSWFIRRNMITADLPDRWVDVAYMAANANDFTSPHQRSYIAVWNSMATMPTAVYAGAECLFMIIMRGGIADCVDCSELAGATIGDKDGDGAFEFWDAWGNPIGFLLWPSAVELPAGDGVPFFSGERSLQPAFPADGQSVSPSLGMKPLIYSAGPDGEYGFETQASESNLSVGAAPPGRDCGNWTQAPTSLYGGLAPDPDGRDNRADNITNLDEEAKR
jgi:prepilin-type N-terminal cleavage/methylation domain-containing protein